MQNQALYDETLLGNTPVGKKKRNLRIKNNLMISTLILVFPISIIASIFFHTYIFNNYLIILLFLTPICISIAYLAYYYEKGIYLYRFKIFDIKIYSDRMTKPNMGYFLSRFFFKDWKDHREIQC